MSGESKQRLTVGDTPIRLTVAFGKGVLTYEFVEPTLEHRIAAAVMVSAQSGENDQFSLYRAMMVQCVLSLNGEAILPTDKGRAAFWSKLRYVVAFHVQNDFIAAIQSTEADLGN